MRVETVKDLGVVFDKSYTFEYHIERILNKAMRMCGFVKRQCKDFKNIPVAIKLYCAFVRSSLEYCSLVWDPYYSCSNIRLERVQRKFVNFLLFKLNINKNLYTYEERLELVGLKSLESRRKNAIVVFGYKVLNNPILFQIDSHRTNCGVKSCS